MTPKSPVPRALPSCAGDGAAFRARSAADRDWPEYLGGPDRAHYSTLDQINAANVGTLQKAWEYHTGTFGQMQCNPVVVDGILYGATGTSGIFALDAATGKPLWHFTVPGVLDPTLANNRGVAYWTDGTSRAILCTVGSWLYALDAADRPPDPRVRQRRQGEPRRRASARRPRTSSCARRRRGRSSAT